MSIGADQRVRIKLPRGQWGYDPEDCLGEGGLGDVFAGYADGYGPLAVKRLKLDADKAAHRELRIAEELADRELVHVIPILDSGLDAESDRYYIVMARADGSLQDHLDCTDVFPCKDVREILLQITEGLLEVPEIVHRDLKPDNVLYHQGRWKIADLGIARFVEESTSLDTLKGYLTPCYAAPEQWQGARATHATDVYALGCIGYALLTGLPPFTGDRSDVQRQHIEAVPAALQVGPPRLRSLLGMMLRKVPESRPSQDRVRHSLLALPRLAPDADGDGRQGLDQLAEYGATAVQQQAEREARRAQAVLELKRRGELGSQGWDVLEAVWEELLGRVEAAVPTARRLSDTYLDLGDADLVMSGIHLMPPGPFPEGVCRSCGWDVIKGAVISVHQKSPEYHWSASLWYTDVGSENEAYRWWEVSYYDPRSLQREEVRNVPFGLSELRDADKAHAAVEGDFVVAYGPVPVDDEDTESFCARWGWVLGKACKGQLAIPSELPLPEDWWKQ